jgi:Tfp pilus assembly protein PilF
MNKITTLLAFLLFLAPAVMIAQESSVTQNPSSEYPILENKLEKSDKSIVDEKKNTKAKTWLSRADLLMNIYDVNRKYIEGQPLVSVKFSLGDPIEEKTEEIDGKAYNVFVYDRVNVIVDENNNVYNYVETKKIHEAPLNAANEALKKAEELNASDHKLDKKLSEAYKKLSALYVHKGGRCYFYNSDNEAAYQNFEKAVVINSKDITAVEQVDTTLIYHTALMASLVNKPEVSNKYYFQALEYNYPEPKIYAAVKKNYFELGDTLKGIEFLKDGFSKYPDSQDIVIEFINYYLTTGKSAEALEYIKMAQEKDPENVSLYFAEAHMYDKQGNPEKAADTYKSVIKMQPEYFDAYFNLGVVYYYYGQDLFKQASEPDKSDEDYKNLMELGNNQLKNAIEPMEKCVEMLEAKESLNTEESETLQSVYETLRSIYYRFEMKEKYDAVDAKLKKE